MTQAIKNLIKLTNLFLKFAEKTYNCKNCGAPHKAVDPSGYMCGNCGSTNYPKRDEKKQEIIEGPVKEEVKPAQSFKPKNKLDDQALFDKIIENNCIPYINFGKGEIRAMCVIDHSDAPHVDNDWEPDAVEDFTFEFNHVPDDLAEKIIDNAKLSGVSVGHELLTNYFLDVHVGSNSIKLVCTDPNVIIDEFTVDPITLRLCVDSEDCIKRLNIPYWFVEYCGMVRDEGVFSNLNSIFG